MADLPDPAELDAETFDRRKYDEDFATLQRAYKSAFNEVNERFDSALVHAVDQQVFSESEPVYDDGGFRVELPDDPRDRLRGVTPGDEELEAVLGAYAERVAAELAAAYGVDGGGGEENA
jgi:hypothetical protein